MEAQTPTRRRGGRPAKFAEPRRPVTVTLPERTLEQLQLVDRDRARAIVKLADSAASDSGDQSDMVRVVEVMPGVGMILVGPSRYLQSIPWLRLVQVAHDRFLLSVTSGTPVESLELALFDLVETVPKSEFRERRLIEQLRHLMSGLRRGQTIAKAEMLFIDTSRAGGLLDRDP
jgi:hypothetical protein